MGSCEKPSGSSCCLTGLAGDNDVAVGFEVSHLGKNTFQGSGGLTVLALKPLAKEATDGQIGEEVGVGCTVRVATWDEAASNELADGGDITR